MNIRLYNAVILDLDGSASLKKGEVVISDGIISNVIYYDNDELSHDFHYLMPSSFFTSGVISSELL